jgi:uncharacterized protein YcbK (DUF882 family)
MSKQLTKNFEVGEFACHDGTPVPKELLPNVQELAENLQVLRDDIGEPLHVLSGYRTETWNKKVGGKPKSKHKKAMAGDVTAKNFTPKQLAARVERLIKAKKMKQGGLGIYSGFIHYDIRGEKARWNG